MLSSERLTLLLLLLGGVGCGESDVDLGKPDRSLGSIVFSGFLNRGVLNDDVTVLDKKGILHVTLYRPTDDEGETWAETCFFTLRESYDQCDTTCEEGDLGCDHTCDDMLQVGPHPPVETGCDVVRDVVLDSANGFSYGRKVGEFIGFEIYAGIDVTFDEDFGGLEARVQYVGEFRLEAIDLMEESDEQ